MEAERDVEKQLLGQLNGLPPESTGAEDFQHQLAKHNKERFPAFTLIGDIVDIKTKTRYMGIGKQRQHFHKFSALAVKNWVSTFPLPNDKPISNVEDLQLSELLPN